MNNYVEVGKIINTFGIKGELKINSNFEYKEKIFQKDFPIYIGLNKTKELILSHRVHKNYDLILFKGYSNINEVLKYKDNIIYINRADLVLDKDEYLLSDLIGYEVYDEELLLGVVIDYEFTKTNVLFTVRGTKKFYLPNIKQYIISIDKEKKQILTNGGRNLIL